MKRILRRFFTWLAKRFSSNPKQALIHQSLNNLYEGIKKRPAGEPNLFTQRTGLLMPFEATAGRFIFFSDQHKGSGDASDDFAANCKNYRAALQYYYDAGYTLIVGGDCEEIWENKVEDVLAHYTEEMKLEAMFHKQSRYVKLFGNHDLLWFDALKVKELLEPIFGPGVKVYEGLILQTIIDQKPLDLFFTHGHQGDLVSDSNAFSKWMVGRIWVPIQRWLKLNVNTPATSFALSGKHHQMMYNWTLDHPNTLLVTGHTHQPVFEGMDHIQRINKQLVIARQQGERARVDSLQFELERRIIEKGGNPDLVTNWVRPAYYNSGCCCFADGDITGIEIGDGAIRLVKFTTKNPGVPMVCETAWLKNIAEGML